MSISVIVPVYNESEIVPELCRYLNQLPVQDVIIVDGYSTDNTWQLIKRHAPESFCCVQAPTGRALQMNTGALYGRGDLLLFLHSDTRLPASFSQVASALKFNEVLWARFDIQFDQTGLMLSVVSSMMNLRSRLTSICTGDQAILVRSDVFFDIGGFAPIELMEDIDISLRLKRVSTPVCLRDRAITSSRRWREQGISRTIFQMWWLRFRFWCGTPSSILVERYYKTHSTNNK